MDNDGYSDEVVLKADCITTMESLLCFDLELHNQEILASVVCLTVAWCLVLQIRMREKTHEHRNIVLNRYSIIYLM